MLRKLPAVEVLGIQLACDGWTSVQMELLEVGLPTRLTALFLDSYIRSMEIPLADWIDMVRCSLIVSQPMYPRYVRSSENGRLCSTCISSTLLTSRSWISNSRSWKTIRPPSSSSDTAHTSAGSFRILKIRRLGTRLAGHSSRSDSALSRNTDAPTGNGSFGTTAIMASVCFSLSPLIFVHATQRH